MPSKRESALTKMRRISEQGVKEIIRQTGKSLKPAHGEAELRDKLNFVLDFLYRVSRGRSKRYSFDAQKAAEPRQSQREAVDRFSGAHRQSEATSDQHCREVCGNKRRLSVDRIDPWEIGPQAVHFSQEQAIARIEEAVRILSQMLKSLTASKRLAHHPLEMLLGTYLPNVYEEFFGERFPTSRASINARTSPHPAMRFVHASLRTSRVAVSACRYCRHPSQAGNR